MAYFDCNDADYQYFYGRQALTNQLLHKVEKGNFLAIVGASGSGKSSVLRAGLLQTLQHQGNCEIRILVPGEYPLQNLARAFVDEHAERLDRADQQAKAEDRINEGAAGLRRLVQTSEAGRVILVVDQFEEAFTLCGDVAERQTFFETLLGALATTDTSQLCLVLAMRSDFVGKCFEQHYGGLAHQVESHLTAVLPMTTKEMSQAITEPARKVGLGLDPGLVNVLLEEVERSPGGLPLLQYTLKELWQRRQGHQLQLETYLKLGGINGTLDQRATELYESFDADQQRTVRHLFQQLTQLGEGTEDTRRRVFLDNLISEPLHPAERVQAVVDRLADKENRLLVTGEVVSKDGTAKRRAIVDVAHEALIRHWRLLRQWIEQNRDRLRQQRRIEASAVTWQEQQKSQGYLLQGLPLDEAMQFQKQQADTFPLSNAARTFIQRSRRQRQWNRLKTASWLIIPALVIVGIVEHNLREQGVRADIGRIDDNQGGSEEKYAAEDLVRGCRRGVPRPEQNWLGNYIGERILLGNCRSLTRLDLSGADLSGADLSGADLFIANLRDADLSNALLDDADLSSADLRDADLRQTNLSDANLSYTDLRDASLFSANLSDANLFSTGLNDAHLVVADLSNANLSYTNLSNAVLLETDLRGTTDLTSQQLTGEVAPHLCNVFLPNTLKDIDPDRDCDSDKLSQILAKRYGITEEEAQRVRRFLGKSLP